ncbi:MAG TPA: bifunctional aldolase/short-chain dehydrogenase [Hyphomicrobiaceae bacterium]|nr:bifunctional aldolase/short-chain dehydrogenase [Hyphomicrobiaceae bacterium]
MQSRWNDADARKAVETYGKAGISEDVALRTYTTRLLGGDPLLVLHGGGNTSVKTAMPDLLGEVHEVLCVKGSGWDMGAIEPAGLPAVKLAPLRKLRALDWLGDEAMVNALRGNLLDSRAPNPSVETLLHAFLPHKFVDHTHAAALLSLVDQPNGEELVAEVYDGTMGLVPYVIPGFSLAKLAAEVYAGKPDVEGLILHKHGIFTFGADAREAYERMIEHVSRAEARLAKGRRNVFAAGNGGSFIVQDADNRCPRPGEASDPVSPAEIAPILRGAVAVPAAEDGGEPKRFVLEFRSNDAIGNYVDGADLARYAQRGVVTPDHIIRTKNFPLIVPAPVRGRLGDFAIAVEGAVTQYATDYDAMFARQNARVGGSKVKLDASPRVVLVPGVGLFGIGVTVKDAAIAADLAENTIRVVTDAEAIGRYEPLGEDDLFDIEYWSLEQAKLKGTVAKAFTGQVAVVTGAGSGIGLATAKALAAEGAALAVLDVDGNAATVAATTIGGGAIGLACDVTDRAKVQAAFARIAEQFGGVDIVVSNAGAAWQGRIGEVSDEVLRQSFELNFFAHQAVAQQAVDIMLKQGTGGVLLFNVSKQAVNPGPDFGPYGLPKAATLALMRQYAIDYGSAGIRSNGVNADRIRTGLLTETMITQRAKARGVSAAEYMGGNLLKREVTAADVAQAFVALARARATTGHIATVDGGNIAAALR